MMNEADQLAFEALTYGASPPSMNEVITQEEQDICGFCGLPGADKIPHPVHWPGEISAGTELIHAECEDRECARAHALLSDKQRQDFLRKL